MEIRTLRFVGMYASVESQCIGVLDEKRRNYIGWDKLVRAYYHLPNHTAHRLSSSLLLSSFSSPCVLVFESLPSASSLLHSSASLLASKANLTVAATISREGFHLFRSPSFVSPDQPPSAKDRSPHLLDLLASLQRLCRWPCHSGHRKRKRSTDSGSRPQLQVSVSIALILARYLLSLHIPDPLRLK